ncbi:ATP-binding cassette domain-containing protein, partial [Streptomyces diastaticus]|uniref:ATP-binding cassette domain-containing protein n=2 Tax=Streptomyces TaxID=1883 RepID=UPI0036496228
DVRHLDQQLGGLARCATQTVTRSVPNSKKLNGAGKTSLIRVLATVKTPADGTLEFQGKSVDSMTSRISVRQKLGYLPQDFGYYPGFTVREFVSYVAWLRNIPRGRTKEAVCQAVEEVGLAERLDTRIRNLSGGMKRRVGIAQAIVNKPELLLLDEPTAGLDPEQRVDFRALLRRLGQKSTVVVSTHLVEDVAAACSEVTLIDAGRVAFRGTTVQLAHLGQVGDTGDNAIERGYAAALRAHRAGVKTGVAS